MLTTLDPCRLFIMGASGSGTTTLGRAIADTWAVPHADSDDYFWRPTAPPFREQRAPAVRLALMREVFVPRSTWVLSGSVMGWGEELMAEFDAVVFLTLDPETRMARLLARERTRMLEPARAGGLDEAAHEEFMTWARGYDNPNFAGRNRSRHEQWLAPLSCPILRLDSTRPVKDLVQEIAG